MIVCEIVIWNKNSSNLLMYTFKGVHIFVVLQKSVHIILDLGRKKGLGYCYQMVHYWSLNSVVLLSIAVEIITVTACLVCWFKGMDCNSTIFSCVFELSLHLPPPHSLTPTSHCQYHFVFLTLISVSFVLSLFILLLWIFFLICLSVIFTLNNLAAINFKKGL